MYKLMEKVHLANNGYLELKKNLDQQKALYYQQLSEKSCLGILIEWSIGWLHGFLPEGQAGMVRNVSMLRDFKKTEEEVDKHARANEKMKLKLGNWWEG